MFKIQVLNNISENGLSRLPKHDYEVGKEFLNPDGILVRSAELHDMAFGENLKAIARAGAGTNNIPVDACSEQGIVVFNTPGANANAVKELVIAGLLLSGRKIVDGVNWVQGLQNEQGVAKLVEKGKSQFVGPELLGKKLGVIGLGAIGVLVANAANSLGMEVLGCDPFISVDAAWSLSRSVRKAHSIDVVLDICDFITIHIPLNDQTRGMFNDDTFGKMKKGVRVINFSRGELVDNGALLKAIENGTVEKYVTDFPSEALLGNERIIPVPHLGASTPESEENCAEMAVIELKNYLEFGNIENAVNFPNCFMPYAGKRRVCVVNKNIPGIVVALTTALADANINIDNMLNRSKGDYAYTMIDVDGDLADDVTARLQALEGVVRVRVI